MTAIAGRLATYSGQRIDWEKAINSDTKLADVDAMHALTDRAPLEPDQDGNYAVAVPGVFKPY